MIHASFIDHSCIISSKRNKRPLSYRYFYEFFTIPFLVLLFRCRCQEVKVPKCFCHAALHVFAANLVSGPTARQRSQGGAVARVGGGPSETPSSSKNHRSFEILFVASWRLFICLFTFFYLYLWSCFFVCCSFPYKRLNFQEIIVNSFSTCSLSLWCRSNYV